MMIQQAIGRLMQREDLDAALAEGVMEQIMEGNASQAQIGGFLLALRLKGETVEEISGCARAMRRAAVAVTPRRTDLIDTCGTGGDGAQTFNISTTTAFVVAGAGLGVAKHGNRSVSSRSGSADLLQALGGILASPYVWAHDPVILLPVFVEIATARTPLRFALLLVPLAWWLPIPLAWLDPWMTGTAAEGRLGLLNGPIRFMLYITLLGALWLWVRWRSRATEERG